MDPHGNAHGWGMNSPNVWANMGGLDNDEEAHIQSLNRLMLPSPSPMQPMYHDAATPWSYQFPPSVGMNPQSMMQPQTPVWDAPSLGSTTPAHTSEALGNLAALATPASQVPISDDSNVIPQLQNIVATVNLGCKLDLKKIALLARNAEYNPKRFAAVIMRIREPRTTALIFSSGKMVCTGAKTEDQSRFASRKYARIVQKLGFEAKFFDYKIQNMVASCDVGFSIRLEGLVLAHRQFLSYEPEIFPGVIYRMVKPRIVIMIFVSGKIVLTGAKVRSDIYEAFDNIYPILKMFRKA